MQVKTFEGETLDEVIKNVKRELGPDAIILKTVTNKGLNALKRNKVEITAAITDEKFVKKAKVDLVLNDDEKNDFYNSKSDQIAKTIDQYATNNAYKTNSYGNLGLNKVVNSVTKASSKIKSSLDDFLSLEEKPTFHEEEVQPIYEDTLDSSQASNFELRHELKQQKNQIEFLEQKLHELTQNLDSRERSNTSEDYKGLSSLRMRLKTLELDEKIIQTILKKAHFELSKEELRSEEVVYEFALRELTNLIHVEMPLFSKVDLQKKPVVTVLLSEASCGQGNFSLKIANMMKGASIIRFRPDEDMGRPNHMAKDFFGIQIYNARSLQELLSLAKQEVGKGHSLVLDIKASASDRDETRKVLNSLERGFENIEVLINLSAINSELYNRKIISKYKDFSKGIIISYMDQCLSYGPLLNAHHANNELPLKFYGTGPVMPEDIELATKERLIAGLFQIA